MRVKLIGVEPKLRPCESKDGWYEFTIDSGSTVTVVLSRFGLKTGAVSVLKNGSLSEVDDVVQDQDELQIILKSLGG